MERRTMRSRSKDICLYCSIHHSTVLQYKTAVFIIILIDWWADSLFLFLFSAAAVVVAATAATAVAIIIGYGAFCSKSCWHSQIE